MSEVIEARPDTVPQGAIQAYSAGMKKLPYVLNSLGFQALRPGQDKAVMSVMMGRDSVVILPTGLGKSLCFVVPTLCMGWKTIVIYPLIALMRDQAVGMQKKGLAAATISSNETDAHNAAVLRDWSTGNLQFMLVSPERFANANWAEVVTQFPPDLVAMDECVASDTEVPTDEGSKTMLELWKLQSDRMALPKVMSMERDGRVAYRQITKVFQNGKNPLLTVSLRSGSLRCTSNHIWFTDRGEVEAGKLKKADQVFSCVGEHWGRDEILSVSELESNPEHTYDMEVEVTHCYYAFTKEDVGRRSSTAVLLHNCHTFGDWADTFRPGYKFAGEFIRRTRPKVVAAYSATLSEDCESEVREGLGITNAKLIYHYPRRSNLHLKTMHVDSIRDAFPWLTQECNGATIVYASTRSRVEGYADSLSRFTKRPVYYYHGGMKPADKKYQQDKFMSDSNAIIVATNAFGMGIDRGDIRNVIHFDIPGTLVALSQEAGRGGRDGKDAYCTIIPTPEGVRTRRHFIRCGNPTEQDIRDFVKAASGMRSARDGVINAKRDDIARKAGLDVMTIGSVMAFCLGEGIFIHDGDAAKKMRIKFMPDVPSFTKVEAEMRDAIIELGVDLDRDGWLHLDIRALSEQVNREPATVSSRLRVMNESGKIEWVRSTSTKPLRLGIDIDAVDPEAFARLNAKSAAANSCLQQVLDYCDTADEDKHAFLEAHLNR